MQSTWMRAAAAAALALALASQADAQSVSGFVGAGASNTDIDGPADDVDGFKLEAGYYNSITRSLNFQANAYSQHYDDDFEDLEYRGGDIHLFGRDSRSHAIGGFASVVDPDEGDLIYGGGGEGEIYNGEWTLGGAIGAFDSDETDTFYGACGYGRLYGGSNFAVEGRASLVDDGGPFGADSYGFGIGAEYMIPRSGVSIRGGVDHTEYDDTDFETTKIGVGARLHFGSRSLIARDRSGAGMPGGACIVSAASP